MYEEHEDGSFTLHLCEWYEQGRRLVGEYETLADGSGFAVTDEWSTGGKVVVNHPLTRPDGTVMPGISRLRRFDWKVGPDEGLHADDYEIWERELREQAERDRFDGELRSPVRITLLGYFGQVSGKKAFIIEAFLFHQFAELVGGEA